MFLVSWLNLCFYFIKYRTTRDDFAVNAKLFNVGSAPNNML